MPLGFVHMFFCWICTKTFQKVKKYRLSRPEWALIIFGSILPDIDFLVDWTTNYTVHRTLTHSLLFALILGIIVYLGSKILKKSNIKNKMFRWFKDFRPSAMGIALLMGILAHIFLDVFSYQGVPVLWPYPYMLDITIIRPIFESSYHAAVFDIGLGVAWMGYFFITKKLRF